MAKLRARAHSTAYTCMTDAVTTYMMNCLGSEPAICTLYELSRRLRRRCQCEDTEDPRGKPGHIWAILVYTIHR